MLSSFANSDEKIRPDPLALAARLMARTRTQMFADPPGRLAFADCGKGLAVLLAVVATVIAFARHMPEGFGWLTTIERFLHPFAVPALMVFTGMFMKRSREGDWGVYFNRKLTPVALTICSWLAAASMFALLFASPVAKPGLTVIIQIAGSYLPLVAALIALPIFLLLWKLLSGLRTGTIFVAAAMVEILHTQQGGTVAIEIARGLVYFAAGHCWAQSFRALAHYTRNNPVPAAGMIAVWAAFNALFTSGSLDIGAGERIADLPFASLGLGLAGAAAMAMAGETIAMSRFASVFGFVGRSWIAFYAALPLGVVAFSQALVAAGLFPAPAQAIAAVLTAAFAAGAALIALELREPGAGAGAQSVAGERQNPA